MSERTHTAARSAAFVERLLARSLARRTNGTPSGTERRTRGTPSGTRRAERPGPLEMTLRRAPQVLRTIVQRAAPVTVSHHHAGSAVHIAIAMHLSARDRTSPAGPARADRTRVPRDLQRTVVARGDGPRMATSAARSAPPLSLPRSVLLRPATHPAGHAAGVQPGSSLASAVMTTVRREERARVETVVRRTAVDAAPAPASASAIRIGDVAAPPPSARRWSPPAAPQPVGLAEAELGRLADRVVQRIERRVHTQRERLGGR